MMGEQTIHVYDEFGQILEVNGICHFSMESTGKKYIFYHLNEEVQGNRIKMYVADCGDAQGEAAPIPDDVWQSIREYMSKLLKREQTPGIKGLPMKDSSIYLGKVKKIGVPKESIAVFAATNVIGSDTSDTPVVPGTSPAIDDNNGESLDPNLNKKPEQPKKEEVKLEKAPAVATILEPVRDEEIYKKVDELEKDVKATKALEDTLKKTNDELVALKEEITKNKDDQEIALSVSINNLQTAIDDIKIELNTIKEELHKHLEEAPADNPNQKVLVDNNAMEAYNQAQNQTYTAEPQQQAYNQVPNEQPNIGGTYMPISEEVQAITGLEPQGEPEQISEQTMESGPDYVSPLEPDQAPQTMVKPPVESIGMQEPGGIVDPTVSPIGATVIPPGEASDGPIRESILVPPVDSNQQRRYEPEDTLVEPSLKNDDGPKITPVSIVDPPVIQQAEQPPVVEEESSILVEPALVTPEPQYFANAAILGQTEGGDNVQDDPNIYNTALPPENPTSDDYQVDTTPLVENPLTSINDSSNYVPYDENADIQDNHFNEAPVTMPDGAIGTNQMPQVTGNTILTPNQLP